MGRTNYPRDDERKKKNRHSVNGQRIEAFMRTSVEGSVYCIETLSL